MGVVYSYRFMLLLFLTFLYVDATVSGLVSATYSIQEFVSLFIMAAAFTPPDVFSQIIVGSPLIIFYEAAVVLAGIGYKNNRNGGAT